MRKNFFIKLSLLIGMVISISACGISDYFGSDEETLWKKAFITNGVSFTTLTYNTWEGGNDLQWFKFTATTSKHFIHYSSGTISSIYDSSGNTISSLEGGFLVTKGQAYYIKVTSGSYQIAFNDLPIPPGVTATTLTANTWADGSFGTGRNVQWFKFTATTSSDQYIHVSFGTLTNLYIQVYDFTGSKIGSESEISLYNSSGNKYTSLSVTSGQEYYLKVTPYSSSYSGTYRIAFNGSSTPPS